MANKRFTKARIKKVAEHEAGHALYALLMIDCDTQLAYGHPCFKSVWIRRNEGEAYPGNQQSLADTAGGALIHEPGHQYFCTDFTDISLHMAGVAGERIGRKAAGKVTLYDWLTGASNDCGAASQVIAARNAEHPLQWDADKVMNTALQSAWSLLKLKAKAHAAIANALIQKGTLTYEECKKIYEENQ